MRYRVTLHVEPLDPEAARECPLHGSLTQEIEVRGVADFASLCRFAASPLPDHPDPATQTSMRQARYDAFNAECERLGVHYYAAPRESFSMRDALAECLASPHTTLVVEDLS